MQTMLESWEYAIPFPDWESCGRPHLIEHVSAVQSTKSLSNCESEYHALLRSSAHALGIKAMMNDW